MTMDLQLPFQLKLALLLGLGTAIIITDFSAEKFLKSEEDKWKCKVCGSGLSVHRKFCLNCKSEVNQIFE